MLSTDSHTVAVSVVEITFERKFKLGGKRCWRIQNARKSRWKENRWHAKCHTLEWKSAHHKIGKVG